MKLEQANSRTDFPSFLEQWEHFVLGGEGKRMRTSQGKESWETQRDLEKRKP